MTADGVIQTAAPQVATTTTATPAARRSTGTTPTPAVSPLPGVRARARAAALAAGTKFGPKVHRTVFPHNLKVYGGTAANSKQKATG